MRIAADFLLGDCVLHLSAFSDFIHAVSGDGFQRGAVVAKRMVVRRTVLAACHLRR
mgnify:CR=1 FL=1